MQSKRILNNTEHVKSISYVTYHTQQVIQDPVDPVIPRIQVKDPGIVEIQ